MFSVIRIKTFALYTALIIGVPGVPVMMRIAL
jgi:hypothetical protein